MDHSKLLIDEPPLQLLPTLATKIGLNEAIVLQQIQYWISIGRKAKDTRKFFDDRWWVYNTYKEWQENFPWWSIVTIRRTIKNLEKMGLLIAKERNAADWDHTKWYAIDYDALENVVDVINMSISESAGSAERYDQDEHILNKNLKTTSETTTENALAFFQEESEPEQTRELSLNIPEEPEEPEESQEEYFASRETPQTPPPPRTAESAKAEIAAALQRGIEKQKRKSAAVQEADLTSVSESLLPLAEKYIECLGRSPTSSELAFWTKEFENWRQMGITPAHVKLMYDHHTSQHLAIKSPASITYAFDTIRQQKGGRAEEEIELVEYEGRMIPIPKVKNRPSFGGLGLNPAT